MCSVGNTEYGEMAENDGQADFLTNLAFKVSKYYTLLRKLNVN